MTTSIQTERKSSQPAMQTPPVVSPAAWEAARAALLVKEKAHTRARDALAAERRRMPWMAVEKSYSFDGPAGKLGLGDLFDGRRQLIVYRAFFEPGVFGWPDHACRGCSMVADQVAHPAHLNARDTTLAFASRASSGVGISNGTCQTRDRLRPCPVPDRALRPYPGPIEPCRQAGQSLRRPDRGQSEPHLPGQ